MSLPVPWRLWPLLSITRPGLVLNRYTWRRPCTLGVLLACRHAKHRVSPARLLKVPGGHCSQSCETVFRRYPASQAQAATLVCPVRACCVLAGQSAQAWSPESGL